MGRLPGNLEAQRQKLLVLAQRRSFESYMRYGRVPDAYGQAAAFAVEAGKAFDPNVGLPPITPARPVISRATTHYVWRTAGDERVRSSHAALSGQIFSRNNPPAHGHPGTEPNCRCWAEPYYGDPAVPDALLQLQSAFETNPTGQALWSQVQALRRPDGSLAQSQILGRDGTRFLSLFSGTQVAHLVALTNGHRVRLETSNGVQTIYVDDVPQLQTAWTATGPKVVRARRHVAFLMDGPSDLDSTFDWDEPDLDAVEILRPNPMVDLFNLEEGGLGAVLTFGALQQYFRLQAVPDSAGLDSGQEPVIVFRSWEVDGAVGATPIMVDALTQERVRQACKRLPEVQAWTNEAAAALRYASAGMTARDWGTAVHTRIKRSIDALKASNPLAYQDLRAELTLHEVDPDPHYGQRGSIRVDIFEDRRADMGAICFYDIKTGREGLTSKRVDQIAKVIVIRYGTTIFYIIEVRPNL